jgi:two-component system phosphate regulon response regulator PhoB
MHGFAAVAMAELMHESILVLDTDSARRAVHALGLCCAGFRAREATDVSAAQAEILRHRPHVVLLFCKRLDAQALSVAQAVMTGPPSRRVPVMVVLDQGAAAEVAAARELGLTCLIAPVSPQALVDCVHQCLRRHRSIRTLRQGLELNVDTGTLTRDGSSVVLGPAESRLLAALCAQPDRILSRAQLQRRVHGARAVSPGRAIDISICRLRHALKRLGCSEILQTIRCRGYRLALREIHTRPPRAAPDRSQDDPEHFRRRCRKAPVSSREYIGAFQ